MEKLKEVHGWLLEEVEESKVQRCHISSTFVLCSVQWLVLWLVLSSRLAIRTRRVSDGAILGKLMRCDRLTR
uniref:Uncharacterized protein n=1 Tax=Setaria italica TaxID=4555 RepID=K3ZKT3_SETIT